MRREEGGERGRTKKEGGRSFLCLKDIINETSEMITQLSSLCWMNSEYNNKISAFKVQYQKND